MNNAVKTISLMLAVLAALCGLASCGGGSGAGDLTLPPENTEVRHQTDAGTQRSGLYCFPAGGKYIAPGDELTDIIPALGNPVSFEQSESCAYVGMDKVYVYNGFTIFTYPDNGIDYVLMIVFTDDSMATAEGVRVGDSISKVTASYGQGFSEDSGIYTYKRGVSALQFSVINDTVRSIQYLCVE